MIQIAFRGTRRVVHTVEVDVAVLARRSNTLMSTSTADELPGESASAPVHPAPARADNQSSSSDSLV
jgi:hypothetical protein